MSIATRDGKKEDWLSRYATGYHRWSLTNSSTQPSFSRPLGLVELSFDLDGTLFGGRADMNVLLSIEIASALSSPAALRRRIALAWACLKARHVQLMTRVRDDETGRREFVIDVPVNGIDDYVNKEENKIVWMDEWFQPGEVNEDEIYTHCQNVGRVLDVEKSTSQLHVLPPRKIAEEEGVARYQVTFLTIMAHQISDGITSYTWFSELLELFNTSGPNLKQSLSNLLTVQEIQSRLPPAQEDMYPIPSLSGALSPSSSTSAPSPARLRWYWAVLIVLRSLRRPLPQSIRNPLLRRQRLQTPITLPPRYPQIFNYSLSAAPPMNSRHVSAHLSMNASARLIRLCRSTGVSIGAGCFALAGLAMMELHHENESQSQPTNPSQSETPLSKPFTASFPLNPRPFFPLATPLSPDSCMLAFSEGIVMPYLPSSSSLPIETRFKLVAKRANAELKTYQKRRPTSTNGVDAYTGTIFDPHDPKRLLATSYLTTLERVGSRLPETRKHTLPPPPGTPPLPAFSSDKARPPPSLATCGVSSIGSTIKWLKRGKYDLDLRKNGAGEERDFAADYRNIRQGVRARDNEFLIGCNTDDVGRVVFGVSYDWSAISEDEAERWRVCIEGLLEEGGLGGEGGREVARL